MTGMHDFLLHSLQISVLQYYKCELMGHGAMTHGFRPKDLQTRMYTSAADGGPSTFGICERSSRCPVPRVTCYKGEAVPRVMVIRRGKW